MADFLFHKVSEKEKEDIKKQAKEIMDRFSSKLSSLGKNLKEHEVERAQCEREEQEEIEEKESSQNSGFRKAMFENAPNKSDDFIIAEKAGW